MIDEKKLIEETQKCFVNNSIHKNDLAEVIANLPKVGKWIPCSERLPEYGKEVLVYVFDAYEIAWLDERGWVHCMGTFDIDAVTAWMPLPEPYKGENNG